VAYARQRLLAERDEHFLDKERVAVRVTVNQQHEFVRYRLGVQPRSDELSCVLERQSANAQPVQQPVAG
jgi:hypothetical protein